MSASTSLIPCSVVVLTLNEEKNIGDAIRSVRSFAEIVVVDSLSSDQTVGIAEQAGARTFSNPFETFAKQRNWAHENAHLGYDWVLHLDADERMTPDLEAQVAEAVAKSDPAIAGYYLAEKTMLHGKWLRRAAQFPRFQARLLNRRRASFIDYGHGQRERSDHRFDYLSAPYLHLAFSHGLQHWLRKHANYATQEAQQILAEEQDSKSLVNGFFSTEPSLRRRAFKFVAMRLPFRPTLRWLYVLFVKRGILDGKTGWQYARMMWLFQHMVDFSLDAARREAPKGRLQ